MTRDYIHLTKQGEEIGWEIRSYSASERTIDCDSRQVLLVEVESGECTFCDGSYAQSLKGVNIEGYILKWKYKQAEDGRPVSEIEPVRESDEQKEIAAILKSEYSRSQINFC